MIIKKSVIIPLFILIFAHHSKSVFATTYYVSKSGSNYSTIQAGVNAASKAGDIVVVGPGVYKERVTLTYSGTASTPITLRGEYDWESNPNLASIIDGTGISISDSGGLLQIRSKSNIRIENLKVINSTHAAIYINSSNGIVIKHNLTQKNPSSGIGLWSSQNIVLDANTVIDARPMSLGSGIQECVSIANTSNFEVMNNDIYYTSNEVAQRGTAGIDMKQNTFSGNVHHNHIHDFHDFNLPGRDCIYIDAYDGSLHDINVYQNHLHDCWGGIAIGGEQGGPVDRVSIYNNLIYNTDYYGIGLDDYHDANSSPKFSNIRIYNNTLVKGIKSSGFGIKIAITNSGDLSGMQLKNNIIDISAGGSSIISVNYGSNSTSIIDSQTNLGYGGGTGSIGGFNINNPMFITTGNFHLKLGSPAIDTGQIISSISDDFDGISRPQGSGFDIGAYEFSTTSPTLTTAPIPNPTSTLRPNPTSTVSYPFATSTPTSNIKTGDANGDGLVDGLDYVVWLNHYQPNVSQNGGTSIGNFNYPTDNFVDGLDYVLWLLNYYSSSPTSTHPVYFSFFAFTISIPIGITEISTIATTT